MQTTTDNSQTNRLRLKMPFLILKFALSITVLLLMFYIANKAVTKNFQIEKSIMKPSMIDTKESTISMLSKKYLNDHSIDSERLFRVFESQLKQYGVSMLKHEFAYHDKRGLNAYAFIPSRKESVYVCFVMSFNWRSPYELLVANAFIDRVHNQSQNLGQSIILLAYDGDFKKYNIAPRLFFERQFSRHKLFPQCNFFRDGLNFEVELKDDGQNELFFYPSELTSRKRGQHVPLRVHPELP